jgi:ELWxxDGT repeat protein
MNFVAGVIPFVCRVAIVTILLTFVTKAEGQLAQRVKDINTRIANASSNPTGFVTVGDFAYFVAENSAVGVELWRTDGTAAGTQLVKDINVGPDGSSPGQLTQSGNLLYFTASDRHTGGIIGPELFVTDGTTTGTRVVKDMRPGIFGANPVEVTDVNGVVYFVANDGITGYELWKTDGTAAGTVLVKDIIPGPGPSDPFDAPVELTNVNGMLFFSACASGHTDCELWISNGTDAGTMRLKDINPGGASSNPGTFFAFNGIAFFRATEPGSGSELWRSDGTTAGTFRVRDINPGTASSIPAYLSAGSGTLYFAATGTTGREIWKTDGTETGTVAITDLTTTSIVSGPFFVTAAGGIVFFTFNDGIHGEELWRTDGTPGGTFLLNDIRPGPGNSLPSSLTNVTGLLYFLPFSAAGRELWKSDGTTVGTVPVKDIFPGPSDGATFVSNPLVHLNGLVLLSANNGLTGRELWRSDGTEPGTVLVADLNLDNGSSNPQFMTEVGGDLFFAATDGMTGEELWKSSGLEQTTFRVKDIVPGTAGSRPRLLTNSSGTLFFGALDISGSALGHLWKSDGTEAGTVVVTNQVLLNFFSAVSPTIIPMKGVVYFTGGPSGTNVELWKTDGTEAGTARVKDICPGTCSSSPGSLTIVNDVLYFSATNGTNGFELWRSDGTEAGTAMVKDTLPGPSSSGAPGRFGPFGLTNVSGRLFFQAQDGIAGVELWKSDGTAAGTVMVRDILPGAGSSDPRSLVNVDGTLFFSATDVAGRELWKSDGTALGTLMVKDIRPGGSSSGPTALTSVGDALFFLADNGPTGLELWTSDGTEAGTQLVRDMDPGIASSQPEFSFAMIDGGHKKSLFAASDAVGGHELWSSDGTAKGTVRIADIAPGPLSSSPTNFTVAGPRVFFSANDGATGRELYQIPGFAVQLPAQAVQALANRFHGLGRERRIAPEVLETEGILAERADP